MTTGSLMASLRAVVANHWTVKTEVGYLQLYAAADNSLDKNSITNVKRVIENISIRLQIH